MNKYNTPSEAFAVHCQSCPTCKENPFGLCAAGFRMLGELSKMRHDDGQLSLLPAEQLEKPFVKMALRDMKLDGGKMPKDWNK